MSKSSSSSRAQWQGSTRWKQDWSGSWKGWDDSWATTSPISEQISDEHVTTTLHAMLDRCSIAQKFPKGAHKKRSLRNPRQEQRATVALTQARERQEEARRLYQQKWDEASGAETMFNDTTKDLEKAETLERRAKTVTMRTESLMTTEADVFKTLLDRPEEAKKQVNEPSAQLKQQNTTIRSTHWKSRSAEQDKEEETSTRALSFALFKLRGVLVFSRHVRWIRSEEWCFEVRPKGVGRKQPRPSDEMCSVSSDSRSAPDATSDRCHGTFATRVASSQSTRRLCETSRWWPGGRKRQGSSLFRLVLKRRWCCWRQSCWTYARARPQSNGRSAPGRNCRRRPT